MKEELESLGFELTQEQDEFKISIHELLVNDNTIISVNGKNEVWIENVSDDIEEIEMIFLFTYELEKLKQLIKLLK